MKITTKTFSFILLLLTINSISSSFLYAEERILSFDSNIRIYSDGSMKVTETIKVKAELKNIKRGIFRDFPTQYKDNLGNDYRVQFDVQEVNKNNLPEKFYTETRENGIRLYVGDKTRQLQVGEYIYSITYRTNRQLGFFKDYDELYWNVTGNGWMFPIDVVTVQIQFPDSVSAEDIKMEAYTGYQGAKGQDYQSGLSQNNRPHFNTTRILSANEGITIVTSWPKGYITEPDFSQNVSYILEDNLSLLLALTGLLTISLYYYFVWVKVGKDPESGVVFPHYYPPQGYSPASMRYISKMSYDHKAFAAAVVNLAVKGAVKIYEDKNNYQLIKQHLTNNALAAGEQKLMTTLFAEGDNVTLQTKNHRLMSKTIVAHKKSLKNDYNKIYFKMNSVWLLPGIIISIGFIVATFLNVQATSSAKTLFLLLWLSGWTLGVIQLLKTTTSLWKKALSGKGYAAAIGLTLFTLPFIAAEAFIINKFQFSFPLVLTIALIISSNMLYFELLKAPTLAGRTLIDKIDGFKMYLEIAEKDELNLKNPPEKTPEVFESYLPFAMALDVEQDWAEKFSSVFANLEQTGKEYHPSWYHGHHWNYHNLNGFASAVGSNLSTAIASSSIAPGSSSGSGGGGSSGGGGGGGGGGGW